MTLREAVGTAAQSFAGRLIEPDDPGYNECRRLHNGLVDKRPAVIASCQGVADIVDAVKLGRTLGLEIAVRGGGHNVAGRATCDAGLMIDLSSGRSAAAAAISVLPPRSSTTCTTSGRSSPAASARLRSPGASTRGASTATPAQRCPTR